MFFLVLNIFTVSSQLYNTSLFTLGNNLLLNPNFSIPDQGYAHTAAYNLAIEGWNCSTRCQLVNIIELFREYNDTIPPNVQQAMDLNSYTNHQTVFQQVNISIDGQYLLSVYWLHPLLYPVGKAYDTWFNGVPLATLTVSTLDRVVHEEQYLLNVTAGINEIKFRMVGTASNSDGSGIYIANVSLQQLQIYTPPAIPASN